MPALSKADMLKTAGKGPYAGQSRTAIMSLKIKDKKPFIPIIAKLVVSIVDPNTKERKQILKSQKTLKNIGEEITMFQFKLDKKGNLDKDSINNIFIPLRSGNKG